MDRRKRQGVALLSGLLFLMLLAEGILFYCGAVRLQEMEAQQLGTYVSADSWQEREAVSIFHGKNPDGSKQESAEQKKAAEAGKALQEEYGYHSWETPYMRVLIRYGVIGACILLAGGSLIGVLFRHMGKRENKTLEMLDRTEQELGELQVHFQKMKHRLEKEEQDTKSLITDISHQLKTPMASLQMSREILETTDLTEEERMNFRRQEAEELHKLGNLMETLLNLSKLESKLIQLHPEPSGLRKILTEAVNTVYMKAMEKQIDISMEEFQDIKLTVDPRWTAEVFANLLDNAVKYSPKQSEVRLCVTKMASYVLIEVTDQGIGITPAESHRIFKRFYRGESESVKQQEGSGVGLYLARKILEEQGGTIRVKQAAVQGSIFQVTLPYIR